nr:MerR family transcriptional regulator [Fructilactobacillus florum]
MNIETVSKEFKLPKATLRYWEDAGLLPKVNRNQSGYRDYQQTDLNWIFYVQALRKAGMPVEKLKKIYQYVS